MRPFKNPERRRRYAIKLGIMTVAYTLLTYLGLNWATVSGAGSPVWPASGVGIAGLLLGGLELWPAILVARVLGGLLAGSGQPIWADAMVGLANSIGTIIPILIMRRMGGLDTRLASVTDVGRYLFAGAAAGAIISASIGTITMILSVGLSGPKLPVLFLNWALGNFVGAVTVGPLILAWSDPSRKFRPSQIVHFLLLLFVAGFVAWDIFSGRGQEVVRTWHLLPVLVWAALAFDLRGASAVLVTISGVAVWGTSQGMGPFVELVASPENRIPQLQQFIAVTAFTTLFLATIADERRAKEVIRNREERLRAAIAASGAGTFRWRVDDDVLECDGPMLQLLGPDLAREPRCLEDLLDVFQTEDQAAALAAFQTCVRRGAELQLTVRISDGRGSPRILQGRGQRVEAGEGSPGYVTGAFVDTTERTRLEQQLLKAEETYRAVFEQAGVGVARLSTRGVFLEVNDRFCAITHRSLRDLLGTNWRTLADTLSEPASQTDLLTQATLGTGSLQKRYDVPNGGTVWVEESLTLVRDEQNHPAFFLAVVQDITERKLAEEQVRLRAEDLEVVLSAVPAAIWIAHDRACERVTGNSFASELLRLPEPNMNMSKSGPDADRVAHFVVQSADGKELNSHELPVQRAARGDIIRNFEERVNFADGSSINLLGNASPLLDANGAVRGAVAAFIDITDRKRAEARERLLSREVDHRAKNVLAVVQAIVQLTQADTMDGFRRTISGRIQSLARTHTLLAESRWEGVELQRLIADELAPFGHMDGASSDSGRFSIKGPMVRLTPAAAQALALVFHELVTNAVKYGALSSPDGRVRISWSVVHDGTVENLKLDWTERDGARIGVPGTSGFGWTVIRTSVEEQLDGEIVTDWGDQGLHVQMTFPYAGLCDVSRST